MNKLEGHVFQQRTPWLLEQGVPGGEFWNAKSGVIPRYDKQCAGIASSLSKCNLGILKKVARQQKKFGQSKGVVLEELGRSVANEILREPQLAQAWQRWESKHVGVVREEDLEVSRHSP